MIESPLEQGKDEIISYQLNTTPWGGTPSVPVVTIYDVTGGVYTALTVAEMAVVMPVNTPSISVDLIILSPLKLLTVGSCTGWRSSLRLAGMYGSLTSW